MTHLGDELTALLDGALEPAARERALAHLAGCPACREARDRQAAALAALGRLPPAPEPSPGFEQRFYALLARERSARHGLLARLPWRILAPLAAAGAAAAVMVGVGLHDRRQQRAMAEHLDLFESWELVASVDEVAGDDVEVVAHLDELEGRP
jgi:anti-sigma factor RsiW